MTKQASLREAQNQALGSSFLSKAFEAFWDLCCSTCSYDESDTAPYYTDISNLRSYPVLPQLPRTPMVFYYQAND